MTLTVAGVEASSERERLVLPEPEPLVRVKQHPSQSGGDSVGEAGDATRLREWGDAVVWQNGLEKRLGKHGPFCLEEPPALR
jgi:hypothetical protein